MVQLASSCREKDAYWRFIAEKRGNRWGEVKEDSEGERKIAYTDWALSVPETDNGRGRAGGGS
jgi:hypothetical protein